MELDRNIHVHFLKMNYLKKNRIEGSFKYIYEDFLLEFVNKSKIVDEFWKQKFSKIEDQSKGEADIKNGTIDFDYKLLVERNSMKDRNLNESRNFEITKGLYGVYYNDNSVEYKVSDLFSRIFWYTKYKTLDDEEELFKQIINILNVNKNLIIFIPIIIKYPSKESTMINVIDNVISYFNEAFITINNIRKKYVKNKLMYVSFILNYNYIIIGYNNNKPYLLDYISVYSSETYSYIASISN